MDRGPPLINAMLTPDILGYIFELNASMTSYEKGSRYWMQHDSEAFLTIFWGSQVCSLWRDILTDSPRLWGRVVDLFTFDTQEHLPLWSIMYLRTGNAPLDLKARIDANNEDAIVPFITTIVETSWNRFKSIDITFDRVRPLSLISSICERAAPSLVSFRVLYPDLWWDIQIPSFSKLPFSGHAAYLQDVILENTYIDLHTSWGGDNIRTFGIRNPKQRLNPTDLVQILSQFPLLETLILFSVLDSSIDSIPFLTSPLHLRRLKYLSVGDDTCGRPPLAFLASIKTEPTCGLHFDVTDRCGESVPIRDIKVALGNFARQHFDKHPPEELSVYVDGEDITIQTASSDTKELALYIRVQYGYGRFSQYCEVLEFMELQHSSSVTTLEVRIEDESGPNQTLFWPLLARLFPNVQVLKTTIFTFDLWFKSRLFESNPIIFPILREFRVMPRFYVAETINPDSFTEFFNVRKEQRISIPAFYMPTRDGYGSKWRLNRSQVAELNIRWYEFVKE